MLPTVSIVIPIYNRASFLEKCLRPLFEQSFPRDSYEIILVDDGSTDDTVQCARQLAHEWTGTFRLIQQSNSGQAIARNTGWRASTADVIAFIDSDCTASIDWLRELIAALIASKADGIGGAIVGGDIDNWVARYLNAIRFYRHRVKNGQVDYFSTQNVAIKRSALLAVGGFSEDRGLGVWADDVDLSYQLKKAGYQLAVTETAPVIHYGTLSSVPDLVRKMYLYGRGNVLRSANWDGKRPPIVELGRHLGAIILAPWIALRLTHGVSLWAKLSFWPLIMIEHSTFIIGMLSALPQRRLKAKLPARSTSL